MKACATSVAKLMTAAKSRTAKVENAMKVIGSMGVNMVKAIPPHGMVLHLKVSGQMINLLRTGCSVIQLAMKVSSKNSHVYLHAMER